MYKIQSHSPAHILSILFSSTLHFSRTESTLDTGLDPDHNPRLTVTYLGALTDNLHSGNLKSDTDELLCFFYTPPQKVILGGRKMSLLFPIIDGASRKNSFY